MEKLVREVLRWPDEEWQSRLRDLCGSDEALFREVLARVERAALAEITTKAPAAAQAAEPVSTQPGGPEAADGGGWKIPERIGPYRLLEILGVGGMGTVYLAEQSEPLTRQVALKLIHWGGDPNETLRRYGLEREALARLSHPAIAQVYDAGATEHGQPYIVLEHVPGESITRYCDARRLGLRQRVELLVAVCDGVRHAHEKGVIHRDLKPSNILVTDAVSRPLPKVIDFGIAKALEPFGDANGEAPKTRLKMGSPGYISPEALREGRHAVDTRSDVYSLGVVLCELLVGVRPTESSSWTGDSRALSEATELPLPSQRLRSLSEERRRKVARARRLDEKRLIRRLRGELDWIVRRATHVDPAQRYGSAADLADDLNRWLSGRPVEARPPSFFYRARKTVRRHALAFAAAIAILAIILGFGIRSRYLYGQAEDARVQAEELIGFMLDDLSAQLEPRGRLDLLESIAREALSHFDASATGDLTKVGRRPAVALRQVGEVLAARGDLEAALEAYEKARQIDLGRLRREPGDLASRLDLAEDLRRLSETRRVRGEVALSKALMDEAEGHLREALVRSSEDEAVSLALASLLARNQANFYRGENQVDEARASLDEALTILHSLESGQPDSTEVQGELGYAHYVAGLIQMFSLGDVTAALEEYLQASAIFQGLADRQPDVLRWRQRLATQKGQGLASAYLELGRLEEASVANAEALALLEKLVEEEPGNHNWRHGLAWEWIRRGEIAYAQEALDQAFEAHRNAARLQEELVATMTAPHLTWMDTLASTYAAQAEIRYFQGDWAAALPLTESAIQTLREVLAIEGDNPHYRVQLASMMALAASARVESGDVAGARRDVAESRAVLADLPAARDLEAWVGESLTITRQNLESAAAAIDAADPGFR